MGLATLDDLLAAEQRAFEALPRARERLARLEEQSRGDDPPAAHAELLRGRAALREAEARGRVLLVELQVHGALLAPDVPAPLVDRLLERRRQAEERHDRKEVLTLEALLEALAPGLLARAGSVPGRFSLATNPPGATVSVHRYGEEGFVLAPGERRELGRTPLEGVELAPGSWLARIERDGFRSTRYPFFLAPGASWQGEVRLYRDEEIGPELVYVPGGPFVMGGDPEARGISPRRVVAVDSFFIRRVPVTVAEYLEFLESGDLDEDEALVPRVQAGHEAWWKKGSDGRWRIPGTDPARYRQAREYPSWPVMGVSWYAARAFCRWKSTRLGRQVRLPRESEWEKAARGVDGRIYPWGNQWHPSLAACRQHFERPQPAPAGSIPGDESPYGVRDLAGNADEWCDLDPGDAAEPDARPLRGGAWTGSYAYHRCASRDLRSASQPYGLNGFRWVVPAPSG